LYLFCIGGIVESSKTSKNRRLVLGLIKKLNNLNYLTAESIPDIDLYMDQLITLMDKNLEHSKKDDDKSLTKTMINNYTKSKLLPPPEKKKYSKDHIILLAFIYYYKNIISLSDTKLLFAPLTDNYFKNSLDDINLEDIYSEILNLQKDGFRQIQRDLFKKRKKVDVAFSKASKENREYLILFAFVCELAFDVYIKKHIIEQICESLSKEDKPK
jgi:hypothetical protein